MLFTESQLRINNNPLAILDEATYIPEEEALIHPCTIPVMESSLGVWKIPYQSLNEFCENHGIGLLDAFISVCEYNQIDPSTVVMAVDEADIIEYPELIDESVPFVIAPISPYDPIYQLCEAVVEHYMETLDDSILEAFDVNSKMTDDEIMAALKQYGNDLLGSMRKKMVAATSTSKRDAIKKDTEERFAAAANAAKDVGLRKMARIEAQRSNKSVDTPTPKSAGVGSLSGSSGSSTSSGSGAGSTGAGFGGSLGSKVSKAIGSLTGSKSSSASNSGSSGSSLSTSSTSTPSSGMGLGKKAAIGAGVAAAIGGGLLAYKQYQNRPKSVIAKKIASLRSIYQKWMAKAQSSKDSGIAAKLKRGAAKILQVIDKLMAFLQRKADHR